KDWKKAAEMRGYTPAEIKESYDFVAQEQDEKAMSDWEKKAAREKPAFSTVQTPEGKTAAETFNTTTPGHALKYDGVQEGFGSTPATYQFTPQSGPAKGATFNAKSLDPADVKAGLNRMLKARGEKTLATTETPSLSSITIDDLKSLSFTKRGAVTQNKDGSFSVSFPNNKGFYIESVSHAGDAISLKAAYGRKLKPGEKIAGTYEHASKTIKLVKGVGDKWTVTHEFQHFLERSGLLTSGEIDALERQAAPFNKGKYHGEEGRARWVAHELEAREKQRISTIGKIIQKIQDIIDSFVAFGKMTATKAIRQIESGKAVTRKAKTQTTAPVTTVSAYEATAQRWYSQMENFLADKLPGKGTGTSILTTVNSWAKKGLIKQEELDWSGLNAYLATHKNVTKQEVVDFLAANNVRVEEVEKKEVPRPKKHIDIKWNKSDNNKIFSVKEAKSKLASLENMTIDEVESSYAFGNDQEYVDAATDRFGTSAFIAKDPLGTEGVYEIYKRANDLYEAFFNNEPYGHYSSAENAKEILSEVYDDSIDKRYHPSGSVLPKFSEHQVPGGKNYKELLLRFPFFPKAGDQLYRSSHWDEPNVLVHIRFNERTGPSGERILFIEEVQSDWHQKGRKEGYRSSREAELLAKEKAGKLTKQEDLELEQLALDRGYSPNEVPDAPFKKTWSLLAIKRMVRYATENGFDSIAWTPGDVQADRYDLSKQVDGIQHWREENGRYSFRAFLGSSTVLEQTFLTDKELEDYIGKDIAAKIVSMKMPEGGVPHTLSGVDLKVGGEGMKGFYDKILPAEVNKFFNKNAWGNAKVGTVEIGVSASDKDINTEVMDLMRQNYGLTVAEARKAASKWLSEPMSVHNLTITPEMKSKSLREGMPQFATQEAIDKEISEAGIVMFST
ncbi:MAG: hypothetical protein ABIJ26_03080, partial [Candidatus Margulisiibacteriota bacterium]